MSCTHQRRTERYVTTDYYGDETEGHWEYDTVHTTVDLDTHRYKCTQCDKIMYYSDAAKAFYTKGERRGIFE